ncbi:AP endonuclease [Robbsia andropogonis]|uniref:AP endonuclease n=1 Tax=Robbsia andropogonis TaxID=28092 RepID=A0A0F5K5A1_9BURK|nr:sugar phosphate isomerase/epimerase [Robbsia andropogonis]KKB65029.1 AP endonuclease [Robbsia andropogonis]
MTTNTIRPLSLAALTVLSLLPPKMVECAALAGYDYVGLRLVPATDTEVHHAFIADTPLRRETLACIRDTGVRVLDIEILRLKPDTRVTDFESFFAAGALFGAQFALIAGNDPDASRTADNIAKIGELAAKYGIRPCIEPMPWTDIKSVVQGGRIIAASKSTNAGLIVDPIHFDRAASTLAELRALPVDYFHYLQLCDAPRERPVDMETILFQARAARLIPGQGGLDLSGILRALPDGIPISLEVPMLEWAKTASALERATRLREATRALLSRVYKA